MTVLEKEGIERLLDDVKEGRLPVAEAVEILKALPYEDMGFACIDHHRELRRGLSEVIYAEGKEASQVIAIMEKMDACGENVLVTRLSATKAGEVRERFPESAFYPAARMLTLERKPKDPGGRGIILVISAGTSDIPVAEEAAITARFMGNRVDTLYDLGVSGVHRILGHREKLQSASVIVVVAGMEGALPSVVGGLVACPVIAVPTSVGYGASFQGIAALLGMLNSCAAGVTVVNIDNGFGAGYAAGVINRV